MPTCCSETMSKIQPGSFWSNRTADGKDFKNIGHELPRQGNAAFLKWQLQRIGLDKTPEGGYEGFGERYFHPCNMGEVLQQIRAEEKPVGDCVFWIGHASALLCLERGLNILFDPIFSKRASPFSFAGPKRRYPPATQIDELPPIHVITLSHNHYDHLDSASCKALYRRFPDVHFVVPVDLDKHLMKWGIPESSITVLDYWEECVIDGVVISCTAAYHWGLRTGFDRNETLWCGWAIGWPRNNKEEDAESSSFTHDDTATGNMNMSGGDLTQTPLMLSTPGSTPVSGVALSATEENSEFIKYATESNVDWSKLKSYYFTGDTAFSADVFRAIHHRYHHFDMAALPIGAYKPRQFLETMHVAPIDSVRIFKMLHVKRAFGVHFGTFELADDPVDEPLGLLQEALLEEGVSEKDFITIPMGEYIEF